MRTVVVPLTGLPSRSVSAHLWLTPTLRGLGVALGDARPQLLLVCWWTCSGCS